MTYTGEVSYRLDLVDHDDNVVTTFAGFGYGTPNRGGLHSFSYRKRLNSSGAIAVRIWGEDQRIEEFLRLDIGFDYRWRIYRTDPLWDNKERKDFVAFHRGEEDDQFNSGEFLYTSFGTGLNDFIYSEGIDWYSGSPQSSKSGDIATVAYEFVNENIGPAAGNDSDGRPRVRPRLVALYPALCGKSWTGGRAYLQLGDVLEELAELAPGDFLIKEEDNPSGPGGAYQFYWSWKSPRWGKDRTIGNTEGNKPLVFSADHRNIQDYKSNYSHLDEINVVTVVGQGVGESRRRAMAARDSTLSRSPWARRAVVRDLKSATDDELQFRADEHLVAGSPKQKMKFDLRQDVNTRYGRDWDIGDLVHVVHKERQAKMKIIGVTVTLQKEGYEKITPEFITEWSQFA